MSAGGSPFIPRNDADFSAWLNNYVDALKNWWLAQGFNKHDLDGLIAAAAAWNTAWAALTAAQAAAAAATADKRSARAAVEPLAREFARIVQANIKTTNADRATLGITVPGRGGGAGNGRGGTGAPPVTRPIARVEMGQRLQHRLRFVDENSPTKTAKPKGAAGAEVWLALVAPHAPTPLLGAPYRYVELSTRGEALATFKAADAGKTACYALRWVSPRGEPGPWSEVVCATVAA